MTTRRDFLASGGTAGIALLPGWVPLFGDDTDSTDDRVPTTDEREDEFGMEVDYPEEWLRRYRPAYITSRQADQKTKGLYAHRFRSDGSEYDIATYWLRKSHQDGLPFIGHDAHLGDTEPAHVYVDESGVVDRVVYTAYHHFAQTIRGEALQQALRSRETNDQTHVQLRVIEPWHNFAPSFTSDNERVSFYDVEGDDDASQLRTWERRGIFDSTADEAVWDPWTVENRGSWWDESTVDYRMARAWYAVGQYIDIGGSGETIQ